MTAIAVKTARTRNQATSPSHAQRRVARNEQEEPQGADDDDAGDAPAGNRRQRGGGGDSADGQSDACHGVNPDLLAQLRPQLGDTEAELLVSVLTTLAERAHGVLGATLAGVYLTGSFALGSGDVYADVDFLIATHHRLDAAQERAVRDLHRVLPDQEEHWARVLEGSYASLDDLRARADPRTPWLYVDNGSRDMEWSTHDNTEVFRWVLHNRALSIYGPDPATLIDDVPPSVLRHEAAYVAIKRAEDIAADMDYLRNAWGQPHEVLTRCRLLYTAENAQVVGKGDAARWTKGMVPDEWHDLIDHAIADRPDPWVRVHRLADRARAERTWEFIQFMAPLIARAALANGL